MDGFGTDRNNGIWDGVSHVHLPISLPYLLSIDCYLSISHYLSIDHHLSIEYCLASDESIELAEFFSIL